MKKMMGSMLGFMLLCLPAMAVTEEEANKKILKDAIVGAVTGAVATEATKDEKVAAPASGEPAPKAEPKKNFGKKRWHKLERDDDDRDHGKHKHKDKKRPHGWDMGKKTGWGDSKVPPGLAKKND